MSLVQNTFGLALTILHFFGFYPHESDGISYKIRAYLSHFCLIDIFSIAGCLYLIIERNNISLAQMADNAFILGEMCCFVPKYLPFVYNSGKFKQFLDSLDDPVFQPRNAKQRRMIENFQSTYKRNFRMFALLTAVGVTTWSLRPFFFAKIRLPAEVWLPFDVTNGSGWVFWTVYLHQVLSIAYSAASAAMVDPLIAGLGSFGVAQFQILKDNLENLSCYGDEDLDEANVSQYQHTKQFISERTYSRIKESVVHHNAIIRYVKLYEETCSVAVFSQFLGSVFVICVSCLQLSIVEPFTFNFYAMIDYLLAMVIEIFYYCYYGTILYDESTSIAEAIYMGDWYNYDVKNRKALVFLMESTKNSKYVRAGKILDLSLVTFTTIMRRSYSLLAVLKNYQ